MNKSPILGGKEVDLYRFYNVVDRLGGHKRVTSEAKWRIVLHKLKLDVCLLGLYEFILKLFIVL